MSFFGRIGKIGLGIYDVGQGLVGLPYDLATAWNRDDPELDGFFHTLIGRTTARGAQIIGGVMGPEGAIGSAIGAAPKQIRDPMGSYIHPFLEADRWLYTNAVSHPLATLIKVGSLSESRIYRNQTGLSDWGVAFDSDSWSKAYEMTKHQSPGQALAENLNFAFIPMFSGHHEVDVLDRGEANKFEGTDFYQGTSGVTDMLLNWQYDPLAKAGKIAGKAKIAYVDRPLREGIIASEAAEKSALRSGATAEEAAAAGASAGVTANSAQIAKYVLSSRWEKLNKAIRDIKEGGVPDEAALADETVGRSAVEPDLARFDDPLAEPPPPPTPPKALDTDIDRVTGKIKSLLFPDNAAGNDIAASLAQATTDAEREYVIRITMGDNTAIRLLKESNEALAESMRFKTEQSAMIHDPAFLPDYHNSPSYRPDVNPGAEIDATKAAFNAGDRLERIVGSIDREMGAPGLWQKAKASEFYQHSAYTKPVRVFTNIRATGLIDVGDPLHIDQVERSLRESGMGIEARQNWVGKMANAAPEDRMAIVVEAERAAIQFIADKHGVHPQDLEQILAGGETHRNAAMKLIADAVPDDAGHIKIQIPGLDEHSEFTFHGVSPQNGYLMTDMKALNKAMSWWSNARIGKLVRAPAVPMNAAMKVWRAGVLLRPAWPVRVIGENGMAMMAKLESLTYGVESLRDTVKDYASWKSGLRKTYHHLAEQTGVGWGGGLGALFGGLVAGPLGIPIGAGAGELFTKIGRSLEESPYHQFAINGYTVHGALGSIADKDNIWRDRASSRNNLDGILRRDKADPRQITAVAPEEKVSYAPGHSEYPQKYETAVRELQQDPLARVIIAQDHSVPIYVPSGMSADQFLHDFTGNEAGKLWLESTPEGRSYAASHPVHALDTEELAGTMQQLVHQMTASDSGLARKFLDGEKITHEDLKVATADTDYDMPMVHPEYQAQITGTSKQSRGIRATVDKVYDMLGTIPIDDLVNSRYFEWVFRREMERRLTGIEPGLLNDRMLTKLEEGAKGTALQEMRHLMDDFSSKSEFADSVRSIMPFFPAWQETLQRWTGLALENPAFIRRASQVLGAPGKMGITWKDTSTNEEYVRLRLPSFAHGLLGHGFIGKALDDQGYFKFQTSGLSMVGQGLPGFGPWVDVALQPFVKNHPELVQSMKIIYPFGTVPESALQAFIPPTMQRLAAINDDDARSFRSTYNRIILTRLVKMSTGEIPKLDLSNPENASKFLEDAHGEAQQLAAMRFVVGAFAPAAISYDSPYQPLIDKYRELQRQDPIHAQEKFYDLYGEEFFHLTQAFTKVNNGIPPTIPGDAAYEKYRDMVQRFPELGGLIVGSEGGGSAVKFSSAAYQKQGSTPIRPGSNIMMREPLSAEEILSKDDVGTGWLKFGRAMDLIDAEQAKRGLPNLQVKAASDLRVLKDIVTASIAKKHPAWYQDYSVHDEVKWNNKIAAMTEIVKDDRLGQRPDIVMLKKYLDMRATMVNILATRDSQTLGAQSNADLKFLWDTSIHKLKNGDDGLAFSDLFNRWLENDPIAAVGINTIGVPDVSDAA